MGLPKWGHLTRKMTKRTRSERLVICLTTHLTQPWNCDPDIIIRIWYSPVLHMIPNRTRNPGDEGNRPVRVTIVKKGQYINPTYLAHISTP